MSMTISDAIRLNRVLEYVTHDEGRPLDPALFTSVQLVDDVVALAQRIQRTLGVAPNIPTSWYADSADRKLAAIAEITTGGDS